MDKELRNQIDLLECRLAEIAFAFRKAESGGQEQRALAFDYGQVYEQLTNVAEQYVEPDFDSLLPKKWMPVLYRMRGGVTTAESQSLRSSG